MCQTTTEAAPALKFETETCGRCGGSGHYSYCQMYGTTCFKCAGRKEVLTKRGRAALLFFRDARTVPVGSLKVGDWVMSGGITMGGQAFDYRAQVTEVRPGTAEDGRWGSSVNGEMQWHNYDFIVTTKSKKFGESGRHCMADGMFLRLLPAEQHNALLAKAIEYQNSLTKSGKPRVVRGK